MSYLFSISHDFLEVNHHIYSTIFPRFFTINAPFFRTGNPNVPQFLDPARPVAAFAAQGADAASTARTDEGEAISQLKHGWHIGWLVVCCHFLFPRNIGNFIIPIDELIFFRGVAQAPTSIGSHWDVWGFHEVSEFTGIPRVHHPVGKRMTMTTSIAEAMVNRGSPNEKAPWCRWKSMGELKGNSSGNEGLYLVGGLVAIFYFPRNIGNFIIPIDFHIFQRGSNHQPVTVYHLFFARIWVGGFKSFSPS